MHYSNVNLELIYDYLFNYKISVYFMFISFDLVTLDMFFCEIHPNIALALGVLYTFTFCPVLSK